MDTPLLDGIYKDAGFASKVKALLSRIPKQSESMSRKGFLEAQKLYIDIASKGKGTNRLLETIKAYQATPRQFL